ncbi:MAG TPA: hypothetical protein VGG48_08375 [Rhizomicrobium sp.]
MSQRLLAMEGPLRHAIHLSRAVMIADNPGDDEMDALCFVAGEALLRLEFVESQLRAIFATMDGKAVPEESDADFHFF